MENFLFFTFMLFFIIPVSYARLRPLIVPGNAFTGADLPQSEVDPFIRLPNAESQVFGTPRAVGGLVTYEITEKLPENEIGNNEIGVKLPVKEIGTPELAVTWPVKEISSNEVYETQPEKEIGNTDLNEKVPEKEIRTNEVVAEDLPEKEFGNNNEAVENLPEDELIFNDFAELLDMMLPEMKTGDNELAEKLPEIKTSSNEMESMETEIGTVKSVPLRIAKFRPVNRHFRLKWRRSPRPCHHLHHRHHHLFPYSRDMLIPTGENGDLDPVIIHHHRFHRIPSRSISLPYPHYYHHHDDHKNNDEESRSVFKRSARFGKEKFGKHFHHDDHEDEDDKSKRFKGDVKIHKHDHKENGLLQRIRKMLIF